MTATAQLAHGVGVSDLEEFDLLEGHEQSLEDAVLRGENSALLQAISLYHLAVAWIRAVHNDLLFVAWVEPLLVHFFEAVQKSAVRFQHQNFILDVGRDCDAHTANVLPLVEE
eukprot:CAMPEP_0170456734 /NCGR_PEP_ID=MMETSP0123-20130129/4263_1 /TAXON_ID=182087 /ORGANISM="Favella ehrenbergii, Strain Fehren 1" /LENGTH=112 /DNA_ID=CAMNT_0010720297 /DNA_START=138 /DNA_END=476 /DNA_ORIENTATION=+